jgi:hypothetical protein
MLTAKPSAQVVVPAANASILRIYCTDGKVPTVAVGTAYAGG